MQRPVAVGKAGAEPDGVLSADIGCVRLTEKSLHSDPPKAEELSQAFDGATSKCFKEFLAARLHWTPINRAIWRCGDVVKRT